MSDINNQQTELMPLAHMQCCSYTTSSHHKRQTVHLVSLIAVACMILPTINAETNHASFNSSYFSSAIKIVREIKLNHSHLPEYDQVVEYEKLIYGCLSKITAQMERCVHKFNKSFEQHNNWIRTNGDQTDEKARRYCCVQNEFKDCWTSSIRASCSELETRLSKWLPLQMLKDLRTDDRCRTYVLYPHKCRENSFSLWQILCFLLVVPFVAFSVIMLTIVTCKPEIAYRSLHIIRSNQEISI